MATEHSMASLLERVAQLEAALRPFAKIAEMHLHRRDDARIVSTAIGDITVADVRRARRLVAD